MIATGPTEERIALAANVRNLRAEGLTFHVIAQRLGLSYTYANDLYHDPDGLKAKARKDSYRQPCPACGALMSGSNGVSGSPLSCRSCTPETGKKWTREEIIRAFREFAVQFGRQPTATDVHGRHASWSDRLSPERLAEIAAARDFRLPHTAVVIREFGSWNNGIRAAGFAPKKGGSPGHRSQKFGPRQQQIIDELAGGPKTIAQIYSSSNISPAGAQVCLGALCRRGVIERIGRGVYRLSSTPSTERKIVAREFVVFERNGNGWHQRETVEAPTPATAIEKVATTEGVWAAVPASYWNEFPVGVVTKLAVLPVAA